MTTAEGFGLIANPRVYDAWGASRSVTTCTWLLPKGQVVPGEQLAIWQTRGRDGRRGVVAFGQVTSEPQVGPVAGEALRFWKEVPPAAARRFQFEFLDAPRVPLWLDEDPSGVLGLLTMCRAQGNKRYRIPAADWAELVALAGGLSSRRVTTAPAPDVPAVAAEAPVSAPVEPPRDDVRLSSADLVAWFVAHIGEYGSVSEAEATLRAGGPRGYRALRRELDRQGVPIVSQAAAGGLIWRLREDG